MKKSGVSAFKCDKMSQGNGRFAFLLFLRDSCGAMKHQTSNDQAIKCTGQLLRSQRHIEFGASHSAQT